MAYAKSGIHAVRPHVAGGLVAFAYAAVATPLFALSLATDDLGRQEALRGLSMAPSALLCMGLGVEKRLAEYPWTNGPAFFLATSLLLSYALGWFAGLALPLAGAGEAKVP